MQFELRNPMVVFIWLCDVWNMLIYQLNYKHYTERNVRMQKNQTPYKSVIFDISVLNIKSIYLDVFNNVYFLEQNTFFNICQIVSACLKLWNSEIAVL